MKRKRVSNEDEAANKQARLEPKSTNGVDVLVVGTGEYTTGYVHNSASTSDKSIGVVGLVLFDLRRRGLVNRIAFAGTNGKKFAGIRNHFAKGIRDKYADMSIDFDSFPADDVGRDVKAYTKALDTFKKGDMAIVFTPDDTHYDIVKACIEKGLHVLVTKPAVKKLKEHLELAQLAKGHGVLVAIEVHKRWDPIYRDAWQRIRSFGDFSYLTAYMSQPKKQLHTFKGWAGKSSDISYYLNSHHVDFHVWAMEGRARPTRVVAMGATGVAKGEPYNIDTEDTITLMVEWENIKNGNKGTAVYTSSWIAPKSDVHSQQRFFYMGHGGEVNVDQAHRGYTVATDTSGFGSVNPLFMKYTPDALGRFAGQSGYGYVSIEEFITCATAATKGQKPVESFNEQLATLHTTAQVTAILEAGRKSLDEKLPVFITYKADGTVQGLKTT